MGSTAVKLGQNWLNMMELFIIVLVTLCIWVHGDFFLFLEISFFPLHPKQQFRPPSIADGLGLTHPARMGSNGGQHRHEQGCMWVKHGDKPD